MKILNIILSIYIVILTAYPCADKHRDFDNMVEIDFSQKHNDHSHSNDNDLCSPFCVCNCCGQQTLSFIEVQSFNFLVQFKEIKTSVSFYKSISFSNFHKSIWQPPQLV